VKVTKEKTAGPAAHIEILANHQKLSSVNKDGTMVPDADNLINFTITGSGRIVGVANGNETSHNSLKAHYCNAFFGKCMVVIESTNKPGTIHLTATSKGLPESKIDITTE